VILLPIFPVAPVMAIMANSFQINYGFSVCCFNS
jgi:hypothetical protein